MNPGEAQVKRKRAKLDDLRREKIEVPVSFLMATIVHEPVCTDLRRRQVVGDVDRRLGPAELKRAQPANMPHNYYAVLVDDDRLLPPIFEQGRGDFVDRALRNFARVFFEWEDFAQRSDLDLHAATPRAVELPAAFSCAFAGRLRSLGYGGCSASLLSLDLCATF